MIDGGAGIRNVNDDENDGLESIYKVYLENMGGREQHELEQVSVGVRKDDMMVETMHYVRTEPIKI